MSLVAESVAACALTLAVGLPAFPPAGESSAVPRLVPETGIEARHSVDSLTADCPAGHRYLDLFATERVTDDRDGATLCFEPRRGRMVMLWQVGCVPCIEELSTVVIPAANRSAALRRNIVTGLWVESIGRSRAWLEMARGTLERLPGHRRLRHLVIESDRGALGQILGERLRDGDMRYPGFLFFPGTDGLGSDARLVRVGDQEAAQHFATSGDYLDAVETALRVSEGAGE